MPVAITLRFCQGITKIGKGGQISFFSGVTKKRAHSDQSAKPPFTTRKTRVTGVYGLTRDHLKKGRAVSKGARKLFWRFSLKKLFRPIEGLNSWQTYFSGNHLKYLLDFRIASEENRMEVKKERRAPEIRLDNIAPEHFLQEGY